MSKISKQLVRQQIGNAKGLEVPNLTALVDRVQWAYDHPDGWNKRYLNEIRKDIKQALRCLDLCSAALIELELKKAGLR